MHMKEQEMEILYKNELLCFYIRPNPHKKSVIQHILYKCHNKWAISYIFAYKHG